MPDRELGGYANSNALSTGPGPSLKEVTIIISPAAAVIASVTEQTFTVPGVLATDRLVGMTQTSQAFAGAGTSQAVFPLAGRVSAISTVSIPYFDSGTSIITPTTSVTTALYIASARVIP